MCKRNDGGAEFLEQNRAGDGGGEEWNGDKKFCLFHAFPLGQACAQLLIIHKGKANWYNSWKFYFGIRMHSQTWVVHILIWFYSFFLL